VQRGRSSLSYADDGMEVCYPIAKPRGGIDTYSAHANRAGNDKRANRTHLELVFPRLGCGRWIQKVDC